MEVLGSNAGPWPSYMLVSATNTHNMPVKETDNSETREKGDLLNLATLVKDK